jgi:hypothetical protein
MWAGSWAATATIKNSAYFQRHAGEIGGGGSPERTPLPSQVPISLKPGKIQGIFLIPASNIPNLARANARNPVCLAFNSLQIRTGNFSARTAKTINGTGTCGRFKL